MLRNFRKDGHNWKKKKDGKTVKEAHEHLKVRIIIFLGVYICVNLKFMITTSELSLVSLTDYPWDNLSFFVNADYEGNKTT